MFSIEPTQHSGYKIVPNPFSLYSIHDTYAEALEALPAFAEATNELTGTVNTHKVVRSVETLGRVVAAQRKHGHLGANDTEADVAIVQMLVKGK